MQHRLATERMQPELATDTMDNWRALLRTQGEEQGVDIIDTNQLSKDESVAAFEEILSRDGFL
jgi:hypothetical protein